MVPRSSPSPDSVLIYVGLDRVGDSLLKLPFVRGLRIAFPNARIVWIAGKETSVYAGVMAPFVRELLDEVHENAGIGADPRELFGPRPLNGRHFDLVIDTQKIVWTTLSLMRVPHKTFISPAARFLFSSRRPPRGYRTPPNMQRQLLDLLELAGGQHFPTPEGLGLPIDDASAAEALRLLPPGPTYVGLAPGSGGHPKCWPLDRFIALAQMQAERGRVPVFLLGPQEEEWLAPVKAAVPTALFPLQTDNAGRRHGFSPTFTIALAGRFACAVSNDSGVGHMIALGGRPLISLYGPTIPEKFLPMTRSLTIVRAGDYGGTAMTLIPLERVAAEVERVVG